MAITLDPMMTSVNSQSIYENSNVAAANRLSDQIESATGDEETLQACKDFEAYMLEQVFKKMNESAKLLADDEESDSTAAQYRELAEDNYYQTIAQSMMSSGQSIGIAEQLYQSIMNQKLGISKDTTLSEEQLSAVSAGGLNIGAAQTTDDMTNEQKAEAVAVDAESTVASALLGEAF
ncbi:MAG: rod-binding protein [Eubacterium sp.]|nr:rod-binding protein [Eubacterium sp.]